jgi:hypothetical protein
MRSDKQVREEVQETLDQDPNISARDIAVAVRCARRQRGRRQSASPQQRRAYSRSRIELKS